MPVVPELDSSISEASIGRVADAGSILRSPLRALHRSWLVVAILAWVGIAIAFRSDPRGALFWLVVPIYYLVFESPFLYEWRVAVPMQYFLVPFAARALAQGLEAARRTR